MVTWREIFGLLVTLATLLDARLSSAVNKNIDKEWVFQKEIEEIEHRQRAEDRELEKVKLDKRAANRSLVQRLHAERREAEIEEQFLKAKNVSESQKAQYEQEAKLAGEMDRIHREEMIEVKLRQRLRETSVELKKLEGQLKAAYVSKELAAQMAEKKAAKLEEKIKAKETAAFLESVRNLAAAAEMEKEEKEYHHKLQYRRELQDQMICAERLKQEAYEDFLHEKKLLDDVVRRIHDEDQREYEAKMLKMKKTKEEMDMFHEAREMWKQREREELEEETRRIEKQIANQDSRELERMKQERLREERKATNSEKIAHTIFEIEKKRKEEEEILAQLAEEERKEEVELRKKAELEKQLRMRIQCQLAEREQMAERKRQLEKEAREEAAYKEHMIKEFAESERMEQLSNEKRRLKMIEYRRSVNETIQDHRRRRAEELQHLLHLNELELEEEKARKRIIEEERLRMLKEHAVKLIGYLPPGVLREDDLLHLGSEFVNKYGHVDKTQNKTT